MAEKNGRILGETRRKNSDSLDHRPIIQNVKNVCFLTVSFLTLFDACAALRPKGGPHWNKKKIRMGWESHPIKNRPGQGNCNSKNECSQRSIGEKMSIGGKMCISRRKCTYRPSTNTQKPEHRKPCGAAFCLQFRLLERDP